jgi:enamine deaminase RidA (YjgF/YER057c/UK114 family)
VWANIAEILKEAHLELSDIVSIATYVVQGNDLAEVMSSRDENLEGHKPASTLVVVPELAKAEWLIEIAVVAVK